MLRNIENIWLKYLLIVFLLAIQTGFADSYAQETNKSKGKINGQTYSYCMMKPQHEIKGILILLPGWGENLSGIFKKTSLPHLLAGKGYLTIIPELRKILFADDQTIAELKQLIKLVAENYNLIKPDLILGGLSAGGAIAIGFAEHLLATDSLTTLKGVFAVDPPLDLERMYASAESKIQYKCGGLVRKEGYFIKSYLENALGGPPESKPEQYKKFSCHSAASMENTNAKWLKKIPIRLYTEPDLDFVRRKYCEQLQFEDINAFDLQKLHQFLVQAGNDKCQYITTQGKGFHSWNIVDAEDCTNWIITLTGNVPDDKK